MKIIKGIINVLTTLIIVIGGLFLILYFCGIVPYVVLSGSMEPTIETGSVCFINKNTKISSIKEKDIIATDDPNDEETPVELFTYSVNEGWTELTSAKVACSTAGSTATHVYYYGDSTTLTKLAKAANDSTPTVTPALFNSVTLRGTLKSTDISNINDAKNIAITGYGIQTEGLESTTPAGVWGYLNN